MALCLLGGACINGTDVQPQGDRGGDPGEIVDSPAITTPVSPAPPVATLPPPAVPAQPNPPEPEPVAPPSNLNPVSADVIDATALITRQASQMTLTIDDMGTGWARANAVAPAIQQVTSSSHVYFTQGSSYAPGVQNTVAVFRSISAANNAYAKEKEANITVSNPAIGDECLLNDSVAINKLLIFRKNNIVVWLWLKQYKQGDIERYARVVEQRITAAALKPLSQEPSSQTATAPSSQTAVETPDSIQPAIIKNAAGLVTKQAYQMVLTVEDMGTGWVKGNVSPPANSNSLSSSYVSYSQGSLFAPTVQNTVVVYRSVESAATAYAGAKPSGLTLSYPAIGEECFVNNSVAIDRVLAFRKANVLVWIWLKQYKSGDIEGYAKSVEKKITF